MESLGEVTFSRHRTGTIFGSKPKVAQYPGFKLTRRASGDGGGRGGGGGRNDRDPVGKDRKGRKEERQRKGKGLARRHRPAAKGPPSSALWTSPRESPAGHTLCLGCHTRTPQDLEGVR